MHIKSLLIDEICTKSLLYYDENKIQECIGVCEYLEIDYLPVAGTFKYAEKDKGNFKLSKIRPGIGIPSFQRVLDRETRQKLTRAKHNVLFVHEGQVVKGVVHISDFNKNAVLQAIQHDMLAFERNLRHWYLLNEIDNNTLLGFFRQKSAGKRNAAYWKAQLEVFINLQQQGHLARYSELQHFNLSHLLDFGNSSASTKLFVTNDIVEMDTTTRSEARKIIIELRNNAMHARDSIDTKNIQEIHTAAELKRFYIRIDTFIRKYEELEEKIHGHEKHKRAVILENSGKLTIIGQHYPNAIEYFIK
jgi:hypothetical protein